MKDAAALNDAYEANNAVQRDQEAPYGLSGSVYTQITDVEGEQNGFCTYDRQVEKVDQVRVRASNLGAIAAGSKPTTPQAPPAPGLRGVDRWSLDEMSGTTARAASGTTI